MQCSEEFKELLAQPTFGARNLCKHWTRAGIVLLPEGKPTPENTQLPSEQTVVAFYFGLVWVFFPDAEKKQGANFQSVSASALLKQQKQKLLEARKKRSEEIQRR